MNLSYNHLSNSSELDDIVQLADITADRMVESPHMRIYKTADVIEKYASDIIETLAEHEHFIIKDDQEPIGYMSCEHQIEKSLWLFGAYLKPEYRKQGAFLESLKYLSDRAKENGFSKVYLDIQDEVCEDKEGHINPQKRERLKFNLGKAGFTISDLFRRYYPYNRASTEIFSKTE